MSPCPLRVRRLGAALVAASLVAGLSACGSEFSGAPEPPRAPGRTALVIGHRANMPAPQIPVQAQDIVDTAISSQDLLTVVEVGGTPKVVYTQQLERRCGSPDTCDSELAQYRGVVAQILAQVKATTPEANLLEAIAVAARGMADATGPKNIVIVDSGLQTTGEMPMQGDGALDANPAEVARTLQEGGRLEKALGGVTVTLIGLGDAHSPQPPLPQRDRDNLKAIWTAVLQAAGATVNVVSAPLSDVDPGPDLPPVAVVPVNRQDPPCTRRLREDQVGFLPNRADFRDAAQARSVLAPIAESLHAPGSQATLTGTTALPEATGPDSLSNRRAQAVRDLLVGLGVSGAALTTKGVGTSFAGYVDPKAPDGVFKETVAVGNRLVIVTFSGTSC